jgi:hypothetical protein
VVAVASAAASPVSKPQVAVQHTLVELLLGQSLT